MQDVWALEFIGRGDATRMAPAGDIALNDSPCIKCGQCSAHCPVGAIYEKEQTIGNVVLRSCAGARARYSVAQVAPAVRVAIGEAFGYAPGEISHRASSTPPSDASGSTWSSTPTSPPT
jgi:ferredoxin